MSKLERLASEEFRKVRDLYRTQSQEKNFNALIYGDTGTGKTYGLRTARKPVLVHSFDPGGSRSIADLVETGEVIVDARWELEDAKSPTAYKAWETEFDRLRKLGIFDTVGTFVIDSITTWSEAMMNYILKKNGRAGETPQLQDYLVQMLTIRDVIKVATGLPCDFIAIGHINMDKDEVTGKMTSSPLVTGKLSSRLPLLFDEVYVTEAKEKAQGIEYTYLTRNNGLLKARSRLAPKAKLETREPQDIKSILKRAGYEYQDKPLLNTSKESENENQTKGK